MNDSNCPSNQTNNIVLKLISKFRRIRLIEFIIRVLCLNIFLMLAINLTALEIWPQVAIQLLISCFLGYVFFSSISYRAISRKNLLEHINRNFPDYQESAQLLLLPAQSEIAVLQKHKMEKQLVNDFQQGRLKTITPKMSFGLSIGLIIAAFLVFLTADNLKKFSLLFNNDPNISTIRNISSDAVINQKPIVTDINIEVTPPSYTGLEKIISDELNFDVPEGSKVTWSLEFSNLDFEYTYTRSGNEKRIFRRKNTRFSIEDTIHRTSLYRIGYQSSQSEIDSTQATKDLDSIYAITMRRDKAPKIKIVEPNQTLIEIPKTSLAEFNLRAKITDDYGISDVTILASVAKGSGEAVKFRDKKFKFNNPIKRPDNNEGNYFKHWSLLDLGMQPGDEVYFSIVASDNKQPITQSSKSSSVIVRWLDNDEVELAAEGIKVNFVPEYFRSQRQIIIETEQLIADRKDLSQTDFQNISEELGHSQSDLKQKYGQYLGDEFGEGPDDQGGLADGYHGGESHSAGEANTGVKTVADKNHSTEVNEEQHGKPEIGHEHQEINFSESTTTQTDLNSATELIRRFSHNHGSVEIGPMSKRDPKSWMKMAVNEMWQAELHLMLAEPEKALPYEYEAYKFLKLARQADRIYAKRLGFEPPPVTEERRLTGELMNILEYDLSYVDQRNEKSDDELFKKNYKILSNTQLFSDTAFSIPQINQIKKLSVRLLELSEERPVLVKYAAIAEQIVMSQSLTLSNCDKCITQLRNKLWQLLPSPVSLPNKRRKAYGLSLDIEKQYREEQKKLDRLINRTKHEEAYE